MKRTASLGLILFILAACSAAFPDGMIQTRPTPSPDAGEPPLAGGTAQAGLPNPASVFCEQQGNRLEIRTAADGSQSGVCIFADGSECDEWAFFRGECTTSSQSAATAAVPSYSGWMEYQDANHGFKFLYPPDWTVELDLRVNSTTYQHLIWLRPPDKPTSGVQMMIAFESMGENIGIQRTGIGAGDLVERGEVSFLGLPARRIALVLESKDMEIMYGSTGAFERGSLRFAISLAYIGMERLGLTPELEQTADGIVTSFERED